MERELRSLAVTVARQDVEIARLSLRLEAVEKLLDTRRPVPGASPSPAPQVATIRRKVSAVLKCGVVFSYKANEEQYGQLVHTVLKAARPDIAVQVIAEGSAHLPWTIFVAVLPTPRLDGNFDEKRAALAEEIGDHCALLTIRPRSSTSTPG